MRPLRFLSAGLASLILLAATPVMAAKAPVVEEPDWLTKPTGDEVGRYYPDAALREGLSGKATVSCMITVEGQATDCKIESETPNDKGFGQAALLLITRVASFKPGRIDGQAVARRKAIPFSFQAPEGETTASGPVLIQGEEMPCLGLALDDQTRDPSPINQLASMLWYSIANGSYLPAGKTAEAFLADVDEAQHRAARLRDDKEQARVRQNCMAKLQQFIGTARHVGGR